MARTRSKGSAPASAVVQPACEPGRISKPQKQDKPSQKQQRSWHQLFSRTACAAAQYAGHPIAFLAAVLIVVVWALCGPLFDYSDTWQLVINTSTTIVTFLMVFLIQHTQNRDTLAIQLKLAELIVAVKGAENRLATAEDLSEEELEELHENYRRQAEETLDHLHRRRAELTHAS